MTAPRFNDIFTEKTDRLSGIEIANSLNDWLADGNAIQISTYTSSRVLYGNDWGSIRPFSAQLDGTVVCHERSRRSYPITTSSGVPIVGVRFGSPRKA